jgi:hypothetical protein
MVGGKVEFRSAAKPPDEMIALTDALEPAIVTVLRPSGDCRSVLDLARERHRPLLESVERRRPLDVGDDRWQEATDGLWVFVASGHGAEAERLGWPSDELYRVPELWSQIHLTGCALLIGDREVVDITVAEIRIKTASGSTLAFRRKPAVDYRLVYETRRKSLIPNLGHDEAHFRALDFAINFLPPACWCEPRRGEGAGAGRARQGGRPKMTNDVERLRARDDKQAVVDAILAAETEPHRWRRVLAEKVETIMTIRGLSRLDAEREAFQHVLIEYLNETHPNTDPIRCAHCGGPETPNATSLPIGWGDRHAWLHLGLLSPVPDPATA